MRTPAMRAVHHAALDEYAASERPLGIPVYKGLRAAVDAKCKDCIYDPKCEGGSWRAQVAKCHCLTCPLWSIRPAPTQGPLSNPPRDPNNVPPGWEQWPVDSPNFDSCGSEP